MKQFWKELSFVPDKDMEDVIYVQSAPSGWDEPVVIKITDCEAKNPEVKVRYALNLTDVQTLIALLQEAEIHQLEMQRLQEVAEDKELFNDK